MIFAVAGVAANKVFVSWGSMKIGKNRGQLGDRRDDAAFEILF